MILITGGCGYLGSHCAINLLERNAEICIVDNFANSSMKILDKIKSISKKHFKFYQGDVRDKKFINAIFLKKNIDTVIHFAGLKSVSESEKNPSEYFSNNITGTTNIIELMKLNSINHFIFSSSATVYGNQHPPPWDEKLKLKSPTNPYAKSKFIIEEILRSFVKENKEFRVGILRYFNPIGAHPSGLLGEEMHSGSNLVPAILKSLIYNDEYLSVYGNDYPTPDGSGIRDYIHVSDLIDGHLKALNYIKTNRGCHVWNLGSGNGYSVLEIIQVFESILKRKINYKFEGRRKGDLPEYWAIIKKAGKELNWSPCKSINDMVYDILNHLNKTKPNLKILKN
tara:strand:- start:246 stop:1265 length:1020 start_codon:yes stop_codon:yes gene_type:complete